VRCERCRVRCRTARRPAPPAAPATRRRTGRACGDVAADGTAWTRTALREDGDGSAHSRLAAEPGPPIEPGTEFANRYRILEYAGPRGDGRGLPRPGHQARPGRALKFLRAQVGADPRYLERLLNEVRTARQVAHPNVCRVYDVGEAEGRHFLSMEWIDGRPSRRCWRGAGASPATKRSGSRASSAPRSRRLTSAG